MDRAAAALAASSPSPQRAVLLHNDFKLDNTMVDDTGSVTSVFDWDMATRGDPLVDLATALAYWPDAGAATFGVFGADAVELAPYLDRHDAAARYAAATGRDVDRVPYYRAFSYWRLAAIVEGVLNRYLQGVMGDGDGIDTDEYRVRVEDLAHAALDLLS